MNMLERAARAVFRVTADDELAFDGEIVAISYDRARAALLAALDPEDEALVEHVALALFTSDLAMEDARHAIVALRAAAQDCATLREAADAIEAFTRETERLLKAERLLAACRPEETPGDVKACAHWGMEIVSAKAALAVLLSRAASTEDSAQ